MQGDICGEASAYLRTAMAALGLFILRLAILLLLIKVTYLFSCWRDRKLKEDKRQNIVFGYDEHINNIKTGGNIITELNFAHGVTLTCLSSDSD